MASRDLIEIMAAWNWLYVIN